MHVQAHQQLWFDSRSGGGPRLPRGKRVTVNEWERVVLISRGVIVDTLGPGVHRRWTGDLVLRRIDVRPWILHVPMQEVPTADGVTVKVSVAAQVRVADPVAFITASQQAIEALYLYVQVALRELVAQSSLDDLLAGRVALAERLATAVGDVSSIGFAIDRIELRDIALPGELKRAQAEVILARAEGQATLERARAEAAALRTLANAARLATDTPALVELRLVQELGRSTGHTIVLGGAR